MASTTRPMTVSTTRHASGPRGDPGGVSPPRHVLRTEIVHVHLAKYLAELSSDEAVRLALLP